MSSIQAVSVRTFTEIMKIQIPHNYKLGTTAAFSCEGTHGIGKTESTTALVKSMIAKSEIDCNFVTINTSEIADDDFCGYPMLQVELCKPTTNECLWIEVRAAEMMMKAGYSPTGNYRAYDAVPSWVSNLDNNKITVLFLDDFGRCTKKILAATMELINKGTYGNWSLKKGSTIVLSTNPDDDEFESYQVTLSDNAQKTRYTKIKVAFNFNNWMEDFAIPYFDGILKDKRVVPFLNKYKELMTAVRTDSSNKATITAREITKFFNAAAAYPDWSNDSTLVHIKALSSNLGSEFFNLFVPFAKSMEADLKSIEEMNNLSDKEFDEYIEKTTKGRHDIGVLIIQRYLSWIKNNTFDPIMDKAILRIFNHNKDTYGQNEGLDKGMLGDLLFPQLHVRQDGSSPSIYTRLTPAARQASERYFDKGNGVI